MDTMEMAKRVCRIDYVTKGGEVVEPEGSGFHYGGGWIITNSHVVGVNGASVPLLRFTFNDVEGAEPMIFEGQYMLF